MNWVAILPSIIRQASRPRAWTWGRSSRSRLSFETSLSSCSTTRKAQKRRKMKLQWHVTPRWAVGLNSVKKKWIRSKRSGTRSSKMNPRAPVATSHLPKTKKKKKNKMSTRSNLQRCLKTSEKGIWASRSKAALNKIQPSFKLARMLPSLAQRTTWKSNPRLLTINSGKLQICTTSTSCLKKLKKTKLSDNAVVSPAAPANRFLSDYCILLYCSLMMGMQLAVLWLVSLENTWAEIRLQICACFDG